MSATRKKSEIEIQDPETWVDLYGNYLFRFALSRIQNPHVAEDLVQETYLAALRNLKKFEGRSSIKSWLVAILKHKIVDYFRRAAKVQSSDDLEMLPERFDALFNERGHWKNATADWTLNPMRVYENKEFMDILYHCLSQLPQRLANIFMLREMEGLSTAEICKVLDISSSNVWVMLYRARMGLRECVEDKWEGSYPEER